MINQNARRTGAAGFMARALGTLGAATLLLTSTGWGALAGDTGSGAVNLKAYQGAAAAVPAARSPSNDFILANPQDYPGYDIPYPDAPNAGPTANGNNTATPNVAPAKEPLVEDFITFWVRALTFYDLWDGHKSRQPGDGFVKREDDSAPVWNWHRFQVPRRD